MIDLNKNPTISDAPKETDSLEFSDISGNFERSCEFRKETIAYIEQSLSKKNSKPLSDVSDDRIITNFRDVGKAIRASSADGKFNIQSEKVEW